MNVVCGFVASYCKSFLCFAVPEFKSTSFCKDSFYLLFLCFWFHFCDSQCMFFLDLDSFGKPAAGSDEPQQSGWFRSFTIAAYKPYFDVDTADVLERIKDSLFPFNGSFSEKTANNPDLWVCYIWHASLTLFALVLVHTIKHLSCIGFGLHKHAHKLQGLSILPIIKVET